MASPKKQAKDESVNSDTRLIVTPAKIDDLLLNGHKQRTAKRRRRVLNVLKKIRDLDGKCAALWLTRRVKDHGNDLAAATRYEDIADLENWYQLYGGQGRCPLCLYPVGPWCVTVQGKLTARVVAGDQAADGPLFQPRLRGFAARLPLSWNVHIKPLPSSN